MKSQTCLKCNGENIAEISYGYSTGDVLEESAKFDKIILGGCSIESNTPRWHCNDCKYRCGIARIVDDNDYE